MTVRARLAIAGALVCALSLGVLAASSKLNAATANTQIQIADILYDHADYRAAMRLYLRASECEDPAVRDRARAGTIRAALRIAEFGVAAAEMESLRGVMRNDAPTLTLAGDTLWASGRFDEAESAYRDALALDSGSGRARNGLAKALASKSRLDAALDQILAALRESPTDPDLQHTLGNVYERMHRFDEAASAYSAFLTGFRGASRSDTISWARSHVAYLRSFAGSVPYQMFPRDGIRRHVVDFRLVNGKAVIKARVNGSRPMDFALDTGAEQTVLSEHTARRLGVKSWTETLTAGVGQIGLRGLQVGKLNSLEVGTLTVRNVPCLIKSPPLRGLPTDETEGFSPLALGLSMTVDYRNRKLTFGDPVTDDGPARELPLRLNRLASVRGDVNGTPVSFIVDTGGEAISVSASTARGIFTPADRHRIKLLVYGSSGFDPEAYLLPGVNLVFGPVTLRDQPVVVLDLRAPSVLLGYEIGGIVGYRFLGKYRVDFDLERSVLRLRDM